MSCNEGDWQSKVLLTNDLALSLSKGTSSSAAALPSAPRWIPEPEKIRSSCQALNWMRKSAGERGKAPTYWILIKNPCFSA
jgi:hypothetical protein